VGVLLIHSGNIVCKSDLHPATVNSDCSSSVNHYTYDGANNAGPHAVTRIAESGGARTFQYSANGLLIHDEVNGVLDRSFSYTAFNKLQRVRRDGQSSDFHYGPSRSRFLHRKSSNQEGQFERIHYVGSVEFVYYGANAPASDDQYAKARRAVSGVLLETLERSGESLESELLYQHVDHLGSIVAFTDAFGDIRMRQSFDPWGARREERLIGNTWNQWAVSASLPDYVQASLDITSRGFTGHEHLDRFGLIHMNGRVYDPIMARFLQADPFMEDTGTLNRYTYVHNNPMVHTDPSGFFSLREAASYTIAAVAIMFPPTS